jgi:signal peptidase II
MLSRKLRFALPLALSVLLVDCATKELAVTTLSPEHTPHAVVGDVVRLTLAYNPHAAMGLPLGTHGRWPLVALGLFITLILVRMLWITPLTSVGRRIALGLILGGAVGNLVSRVRSPQGVVDFIDIGTSSWRFYLFNVADIAVVCGACLLGWALWREHPGESSPPGDTLPDHAMT